MKREVLVSLQTAYDLEVEVENNPYDPGLMVFMDYRDYVEQKVQCMEEEYPSFLHAMPMSPTRVLFEETCLASRNAIPFNLLKKKLMPRLKTMGIRVTKVYEEEWSYIPLGRSRYQTLSKKTLILVQQPAWYILLLVRNQMWKGFLGSQLSSTDLLLFAVYMFVLAPNSLRMGLVKHLLSDPTRGDMVSSTGLHGHQVEFWPIHLLKKVTRLWEGFLPF